MTFLLKFEFGNSFESSSDRYQATTLFFAQFTLLCLVHIYIHQLNMIGCEFMHPLIHAFENSSGFSSSSRRSPGTKESERGHRWRWRWSPETKEHRWRFYAECAKQCSAAAAMSCNISCFDFMQYLLRCYILFPLIWSVFPPRIWHWPQ